MTRHECPYVDPLCAVLAQVSHRLARIERAVTIEGVTLGQIDDQLAELTTTVAGATDAMTTAAGEVARIVADLAKSLAGNLTPDQSAQFDALNSAASAIKSNAEQLSAAVESADPSPAPPTA